MAIKQVLRLQNIGKRFPGVKALSSMSFDVIKGEIHCICGENGAGKSTLIKVISGAYQPDEGTIFFEDKQVVLNPKDAIGLGIQTIYQEQNLYLHLNVMENIFTGSEISICGFLKRTEMHEKADAALVYLQCSFNSYTRMSELTSGERKLVEIAKALIFERKLIILDEPTASFSTAEIQNLLGILKNIKKTGLSIIYISHHLDEVFKIADRVTVIRDGIKVNTYAIADLDEPLLIRDMVGRDASAFYCREYWEPGEVILEAKNVFGDGLRDISFQLRRGEILGFSGMIGSGRSELMNLIFGGCPLESGEILIMGRKVSHRTPQDAIKNKMCFITEDRQNTGLFLKQTIANNVTIANLVNARQMFRSPAQDLAQGDELVAKLDIKARNSNVLAVNLSGGNQQKVVLAKWFLTAGEIYLFDEPTRGIDVGSKQEIYSIMLNLIKEGKAIIMVSSDMPEAVSMSDRVAVMREGSIVMTLAREEVSEENILTHSIGGAQYGA